jgi:uncharacterized protein
MMGSNRLWLFVLTVTLLLSSGTASTFGKSATVVKKAAPKAPAKVAPKKLFLWKVTSPESTVYLYGSIHLAKPEIYPLNQEIETAFAKSNSLALEFDEGKADKGAMQMFILTKGVYMGDSIQNHIGDRTKDLLNQYYKDNQFPDLMVQRFDVMKPWMLFITLPQLELQKLGLETQWGVDKHFQKEAVESGKKIRELESAEFQLNLLSGFPEELQEKILQSALLDMKDLQKDLDRMFNAWRNGDAVEMNKIVTEDDERYPELKGVNEQLLGQRNVGMAEKIDNWMKAKQNVFVVVGAAHLVGERGLPMLLQNKGYKVEQVAAAVQPQSASAKVMKPAPAK